MKMLKFAKLFAVTTLFTLIAGSAQAVSYYYPGMPHSVTSTTIGDNQIDVTWVPDKSTGNLPLNKYKVTYWKNVLRPVKTTVLVYTNFVSLNKLDPSSWYIVNVEACNALGCTSADTWSWKPTTPYTADVLSFKPLVVNGGKASTVCFDVTADGGLASTITTFKKNVCPPEPVFAGPFPVVDPTATKVPGK
jgi:hypothetical protein